MCNVQNVSRTIQSKYETTSCTFRLSTVNLGVGTKCPLYMMQSKTISDNWTNNLTSNLVVQ